MDFQEAKALTVSAADKCEHYKRESDVSEENPPVSRERIKINIDGANHVMAGDNNTVVYEECADVISCDHDVPKTSQAAEKAVNESNRDLLLDHDDINEKDNFPGNLRFQQQQNSYSQRKKERRYIGKLPTSITSRNKNKKGWTNESETERLDFRRQTFSPGCTFFELEEDDSGYKATIRASAVQVDFPESKKEDFSHVTSTEGETLALNMVRLDNFILSQTHFTVDTRNKALTLNIESAFGQIGQNNEFCLI